MSYAYDLSYDLCLIYLMYSYFPQCNETLLYFPDSQKKYQDSYEYYAKKNKFEVGVDYTEEFL